MDLFVHRLGLDLLFAEIADALLLLLALTIGPFKALDVSNFCCMDRTCDDELFFPQEAVVVPPGLEVLLLEPIDVVGLLELTVVVTLEFAAERKVDPVVVVEGFAILGTPAPLLTGAPGVLMARGDAVVIFELGDFDFAAAVTGW